MSAAPINNLELQASEERERLHKTALELISKVDHAKQQLSPTWNIQHHFAAASMGVSAIAFLAGYAIAGVFTKD